MRPTRVSALLGIVAVTAVLAFAGARVWDGYGELPRVPVSAPITLLGLAAAVLATALALRTRLRKVRERQVDAKPVDPLVAARAAVLAKASSLVGSLFVGLYGGFLVFVLAFLEGEPRRQRLVVSLLCMVAGLLLVLAALFLERVCRIPPPSAEEDANHRPMAAPDPP